MRNSSDSEMEDNEATRASAEQSESAMKMGSLSSGPRRDRPSAKLDLPGRCLTVKR